MPNEKVGAVWLAYLIARVNYREQHNIRQPAAGEIVPVFDEEVYARDAATAVYVELRDTDKKLYDRYWNDLAMVKANGFVREYVWTYLRKPSWPEKQRPPKVEAFKSWSRIHLKGHQLETHGGLGTGK
jgi:hypothetical protein